MSDENKPKNPPARPKRRRRRPPRNQNQSSGQGESKQPAKKADGNRNPNRSGSSAQRSPNKNSPNANRNKNNNRNRNRNRNNNRKKKTITTRGVVAAYLETVSRYLKARKDYFESFRGSISKRARKTFDSYQSNLRALRKFDQTLKPWQKEELQKNIEFFPEDNEFSSNHPDAELTEGEEAKEQKTSFHELISQKERPQYTDDTEESKGTKEDYIKYKESITA